VTVIYAHFCDAHHAAIIDRKLIGGICHIAVRISDDDVMKLLLHCGRETPDFFYFTVSESYKRKPISTPFCTYCIELICKTRIIDLYPPHLHILLLHYLGEN